MVLCNFCYITISSKEKRGKYMCNTSSPLLNFKGKYLCNSFLINLYLCK